MRSCIDIKCYLIEQESLKFAHLKFFNAYTIGAGPLKARGLCEYSRAGPLTDMKVEFIKGLNQFMYTNADKII